MVWSLRSAPLLVGIAAITAGAVHVAGQQRPADQSYVARATAVLVDVVVRDRQGRPVLDLKADDFEITEDSVPQQIGSFTLVSRGTGLGIGVRVKKDDPTTVVTPTGTPASSEADEAPVAPAVVAMVFDALSPEALRLCQRAALANIKMVGETKARMAVFSTEPYIRVLQRYTTDPGLLRLGVEHLTPTGTEVKDSRDGEADGLASASKEIDASGLDPIELGERRRRAAPRQPTSGPSAPSRSRSASPRARYACSRRSIPSTAIIAATARPTRSSRCSSRWRSCPAGRASSSSRKACLRRLRSSRSCSRSSRRRTARTSPSTRWTPTGCARSAAPRRPSARSRRSPTSGCGRSRPASTTPTARSPRAWSAPRTSSATTTRAGSS